MLCKDRVTHVDYKDSSLLRRFMSERGKIKSRSSTGTCTQHQAAVALAIKNAREMALLPYVVRTLAGDKGGRRRGGPGGGRPDRPDGPRPDGPRPDRAAPPAETAEQRRRRARRGVAARARRRASGEDATGSVGEARSSPNRCPSPWLRNEVVRPSASATSTSARGLRRSETVVSARAIPSTDDPSAIDGRPPRTPPPADSGAILEQMEQLQREFDAEIIDFETYDARKAELLSHIQI